MSLEEHREFLCESLGNGARVSSEGAIHFICMDWRRIGDLMEVGRKLYGEMLSLVAWNKTNAGPGSPYRSQHELIGVFRVGRHLRRNNIAWRRFGRNRSDVWTYPDPKTTGKTRVAAPATDPTPIPVALVADALLDCTAKREIVLDPFAGSGATILAAEKVVRIAYALEREARLIDVAIQRWQRMTKREVTLACDGRDYAALAEFRGSRQVAPRRLNAVDDADTAANVVFGRDSEVAAEREGGHD
jgi:DNA modification methylase